MPSSRHPALKMSALGQKRTLADVLKEPFPEHPDPCPAANIPEYPALLRVMEITLERVMNITALQRNFY